jgi:hypothetical protein
VELYDLLGRDQGWIGHYPPLADAVLASPETVEDRSYIALPDCGIEFSLNEAGTIEQILIHAEGHDGFEACPLPLPHGLGFALSRDAVRALLGTPERSGEGGVLPVLGAQAPWDRFRCDRHLVRVGYDNEARTIRTIAFMPIAAAP